ncbi:MAG: serine/threonine-protein phosphatase, partial [Acidimicrobiia bacterium]|nr:serine/threonine-protein phosphatase [Acidimicrobiia bacterium]
MTWHPVREEKHVSQTVKEQREELLRMQRLLLPASLPRIGCTEAAAAYRADNSELRLGGDWFDLVDRPESNSIVGIVGDVVGHGVEQISVMGQLRAASSALAHAVDGPAEILAGLDRFARTLSGAEFATLCVVVFDGSPNARISSAGHPPPVVVTSDGHVQVIEAGRRPPLTLQDDRPIDG